MTWKTPRNWAIGDAVTRARLNAISDSLAALKDPPSDEYLVPAVDIAISSTSLVDIDSAGGLLITTYGGDLLIGLNFSTTTSVASVQVTYDILLNNLTYLSSRTATARANGVFYVTTAVTTDKQYINAVLRWPGLAAGTYSVMPQVKVNTGSVTFKATNTGAYWWVRED